MTTPGNGSGDTTAHTGRCSTSKVIFVNRFYYPDLSATSQILYDLTRRLAANGMAVHVVCSRQLYGNAAADLSRAEAIEGVHVHRVNGTRFGRGRLAGRAIDYLSFYFQSTMQLRSLVTAGDIVVAKTDPPLISVPVALIAHQRKAYLVNWLQDVFPEVASHLEGYTLPRFVDSLIRRLRNWSLKKAAVNVVIGERMKEHLIRCGIDEYRVRVIENWADAQFISPKLAELSALRVKHGLQQKFVVGYSGNLGRAHDYHTILEAAIELRGQADIVFMMIGGGLKMQQLEQAVTKERLDNFIFLPYQPRDTMGDSMAAADVHLTCLLPELEGLIVPSKFYGILAAGRPTITIGDTDGEVARVIKREKCGAVVLMNDAAMLKSELLCLKNDPLLIASMGDRAHQVFVSRYTADYAARAWQQLLSIYCKAQDELPARDAILQSD